MKTLLLIALAGLIVSPARSQTPEWVDASTFGFRSADATTALQSAINTGARTVYVPNLGIDWIIRPIFLVSNQTIVFERGVVVTAKRGEFHGKADSLFSAYDKDNLTLIGYGATLRMWKEDYTGADYTPSESRMGIRLYSVSNARIQGFTIKDTGGDGIYLGVNQLPTRNKNIQIRDVFCDNNYRQGISVTCAENLLIENCILNNTSGTAPQSGIDFEPDYSQEVLINCVVRNCIFENNGTCGLLLNIWDFTNVNLLSGSIEHCTFRGNLIYGIKLRKHLPYWTMRDCLFVANGLQAYSPYPGVGIYVETGPPNFSVDHCAFWGNKDGPISGYITLGSGCLTGVQPRFAFTEATNPYYMYLSETCPTAIKTGSSSGGFLGARPVLAQAGAPSVSGRIQLQIYTGDLTQVALNVQLRRGDWAVYSQTRALDSAGRFTFDNIAPGTYDVAIKACCWLKKVIPAVTVIGATDLGTLELIAGDTSGDNRVTAADLSIVLMNMDGVGD